jgi:hypothetical protein
MLVYGSIWDFYVWEDYVRDCFVWEKFVAPSVANVVKQIPWSFTAILD